MAEWFSAGISIQTSWVQTPVKPLFQKLPKQYFFDVSGSKIIIKNVSDTFYGSKTLPCTQTQGNCVFLKNAKNCQFGRKWIPRHQIRLAVVYWCCYHHLCQVSWKWDQKCKILIFHIFTYNIAECSVTDCNCYNWSCPLLSTTVSLTPHMPHDMSTWGEKPFKCEHCPFALVQRFHLTQHVVAKHTDERPFNCNQCSFAAVKKSDLTSHVKVKHIE